MENTIAGEAPVVEFCAKALAPVAMFKAEADIRFYLNGICVQPGPDGVGCFVIGCDGRRLAVWFDKDGKCSRRIVLRVTKGLVSASRKKGAKNGRIVLDAGRLVALGVSGDECFIQAGKAEIECSEKPGMGGYPDILRVVPKESDLVPGAVGYINGRYLEDIGKAAKMLSRDNCGMGVFNFTNGNTGPIVTRFDGEENFMVVTVSMISYVFERWTKLPSAIRREHAVAAREAAKEPAPATLLHPMGSMGEEVAL